MPPEEFCLGTKPSSEMPPRSKSRQVRNDRSERRSRDESYPGDGLQPVREIVSVMPGDQLLLDRLKALSQVADQADHCFEDKPRKLGQVGTFVCGRPQPSAFDAAADRQPNMPLRLCRGERIAAPMSHRGSVTAGYIDFLAC